MTYEGNILPAKKMKGQFRLEDLEEVLREEGVLDKELFDHWTSTIPSPPKSKIIRKIVGEVDSRYIEYRKHPLSVGFTVYDDQSGENVTVRGWGLIPKIPMRKEVGAMVAAEHGLEFNPRGEGFEGPEKETNDLDVVRGYISAVKACKTHLSRIASSLTSHIYALGDEGEENK